MDLENLRYVLEDAKIQLFQVSENLAAASLFMVDDSSKPDQLLAKLEEMEQRLAKTEKLYDKYCRLSCEKDDIIRELRIEVYRLGQMNVILRGDKGQ